MANKLKSKTPILPAYRGSEIDELRKLLRSRSLKDLLCPEIFQDLDAIVNKKVNEDAKKRVLANEPDWQYLAVMDGDLKTTQAINKASKRITKALNRVAQAIEDADKT